MSYGISLTISYQVVINIGVVTGLLPTKGMVLPFISYGGSSIVLLMLMIGLLLNALSSEIRSYDKDRDQYGISGTHNKHMRDLLEAWVALVIFPLKLNDNFSQKNWITHA